MSSVLIQTWAVNKTRIMVVRYAKLYWHKDKGFRAELYQKVSTDEEAVCIGTKLFGCVDEKEAKRLFKKKRNNWRNQYQ